MMDVVERVRRVRYLVCVAGVAALCAACFVARGEAGACAGRAAVPATSEPGKLAAYPLYRVPACPRGYVNASAAFPRAASLAASPSCTKTEVACQATEAL